MKNNGKRTWTKDEYEKTLELFFELVQARKGFSKDEIKVIHVARDLDRSVNSIIMRLQNYVYCFRQICPDKADEYGIGNGLSNGGKECLYMLENFMRTRDRDMLKETKVKMPGANTSVLNRIILKLAVKLNDEDFDSDGLVLGSLKTLFTYLDNDTFTWSQLDAISEAVRGLLCLKDTGRSVSRESLFEIFDSVLEEQESSKLKKLISLFK